MMSGLYLNQLMSQLVGPDLLAKVKELGDVSKSDLVRSCGYVSTKKDGTERLNFTAFYEALLNAKGVAFDGDGGGQGGRGRGKTASYRTSVHAGGNVVISSCYVKELGLESGDVLNIKVSRGRITLVPLGADED